MRDRRAWMWLDVALVAAIALVCIAAVHLRAETGQGAGPAWMLFPVGLLCWLSGRRFNAGFLLKGALTWGAVFVFLLAAYAYRLELRMAGERALAAVQ